MNRNVDAVIGGQFGSEGKGALVQNIWYRYPYHVRVGAANAGHTGWILGQKVVSQQLPMAAWAWKGYRLLQDSGAPLSLLQRIPRPICVIGPGAVISMEILEREILDSEIPAMSLYIDPRAHVITQAHIDAEQLTDLAARIGSTSTVAREGIGTATAARVMREAGCILARDTPELHQYLEDVPALLAAIDEPVLLEGTQGTGLSLTTGFFPFTTSRNTTAAGLCADAGVPPNRIRKVMGVFRTYPIRVAGNSGPFFDGSDETTFEEIGVPDEVTTVTRLRRRIATFSWMQVRDAHILNGFTEAYLTFFNYVEPGVSGVRPLSTWSDDEVGHLMQWENGFKNFGIPLVAANTGPEPNMWAWLDPDSDSIAQIGLADTTPVP